MSLAKEPIFAAKCPQPGPDLPAGACKTKTFETASPTNTRRAGLREAAYHEAGHVVMAYHLLNLRGGAWIRADGTGLTEVSTGVLDWRWIGDTIVAMGTRRRVQAARIYLYILDITLAGPAAELIGCDCLPADFAWQLDYSLGTTGVIGLPMMVPPPDHMIVATIVWGLHYGFTGEAPPSQGGDYPSRFEYLIDRRTTKVHTFLGNPLIWTQVEIVAAELVKKKRVSYQWLDRTLRRTSPVGGPYRAWRWQRSAAREAARVRPYN